MASDQKNGSTPAQQERGDVIKTPGDMDYDPDEDLGEKNLTTYFETLLHMLKVSLGTGVLAMPKAFANAGYLLGMIGTIIVGVLCTYTTQMLVQSEYELSRRLRVPSMTYPQTFEAAFSEGPKRCRPFAKAAGVTCNLILFLLQCGLSCVYMVFVADNLKAVLDQYIGTTDIRLYMACLLGPLIILCWFGNLKYLAPLSFFGNSMTMICYCITFWYVLTDLPSFSTRKAVVDLKQFPLFIGTALFAMEAISVVIPLKNEMKRPAQFRGSFGVLNCSMVPITILYLLVGLGGYLKYGDAARGSISLNLPTSEVPAQCVKLMLAFSVLISNTVLTYVTSTILWEEFLKSRFENSKRKVVWELSARAFLVLATFVIAASIPNLELFISLIGALGLANLGLAFPVIAETLTFWDRYHGCWFFFFILKNICLLLAAIYAFFIGGATSIITIYDKLMDGTLF